MAGIRESSAQATIEYQTDAATVAQACQDALASLGKVTDVSRETGTITGKIDVGRLGLGLDNAIVVLRISRKADSTELSIQATKGEALFTGGGAQRALSSFMQAMGKDKRLTGKSTSGW